MNVFSICVSQAKKKFRNLVCQYIYKQDSDFRQFCGMVESFPFLPLDKLPDRMTCFKEIIPPDAEVLVFYFDAYYVNSTYIGE